MITEKLMASIYSINQGSFASITRLPTIRPFPTFFVFFLAKNFAGNMDESIHS